MVDESKPDNQFSSNLAEDEVAGMPTKALFVDMLTKDIVLDLLTMKYCVTFLFVIVLASISTAQTPATKGVAKCAVQGKVIQEPGEHPLKKTNIQLMGQGLDGSTIYSATTDAEGYFKIEDVNPGRYRILLERAGFVEADKGGGRKKSLVLEPGREIKGLVLRMNAAAVLTGKILDSDGDPMPNVAVSVIRYGSSSSRRNFQANGYGSTNDLGEYRIGGLSPGRYLITAAAPSSLSQTSQPEKKDASKEESRLYHNLLPRHRGQEPGCAS